jgi:hypothetical protein
MHCMVSGRLHPSLRTSIPSGSPCGSPNLCIGWHKWPMKSPPIKRRHAILSCLTTHPGTRRRDKRVGIKKDEKPNGQPQQGWVKVGQSTGHGMEGAALHHTTATGASATAGQCVHWDNMASRWLMSVPVLSSPPNYKGCFRSLEPCIA